MALKQDERALLQLVCERGQSYSDLAELLGISVEQVKEKARGALTELGGADPDAEVGLTDYLLGQADPIGRADAVRYLQQDPETLELAKTIEAKLIALAPGAELPSLPEPKGGRRRAAAGREQSAPAEPRRRRRAPDPAAGSEPGSPRSGDEGSANHQSRLIAGLVAGGVVLVVIILAVAGVFSGDGGDQDISQETRDEVAAQLGIDPAEVTDDDVAEAEAQRAVTSVPLEPEDGSAVAGQADFALANDNLFADLSLNGLDPDLGGRRVYVLWLMLNENAGYPVSVIAPDQNGSVSERYAIPTAVAAAIASNARFVQVTESDSRELREQIDSAVDNDVPLVPFTGELVAGGEIPLAEPVEAPSGGGNGSGGGGNGSGGSGGGSGSG